LRRPRSIQRDRVFMITGIGALGLAVHDHRNAHGATSSGG
jgi:hypothetical protein